MTQEQRIRNAGLKARDALLERMFDGGTVDDDLADRMSAIVDACVSAASLSTPATAEEQATTRKYGPIEWPDEFYEGAVRGPLPSPNDLRERDYPTEFENWWATYRHKNRDTAGYSIKKQIAFDAFYFAVSVSATPATAADVVRVKALEWIDTVHEEDTTSKASTPFGEYAITSWSTGDWRTMYGPVKAWNAVGTKQELQAYAQSHFEAAIRSSIVGEDRT